MKREEVVFEYRGPIEKYDMKGPGRWVDGYSKTINGHVSYPWYSRFECRGMAVREGKKAVFYRDGKREHFYRR